MAEKEYKEYKWLPLESNPAVFNSFIEKMGVKGVACCDVYGFDGIMADFVPRPHLALILCYPNYRRVDELMEPVYDALEGVKLPDDVFFMQQNIHNACGTFALFHSLANRAADFDVGTGAFAKWFEKAKQIKDDERSDLMAEDEEITKIHESCAIAGDTAATDEGIEHHFITYVNVNNNLYEIDSRQSYPRYLGRSSDETLIVDAGAHAMMLVKQLRDVSFSAIAVYGTSS